MQFERSQFKNILREVRDQFEYGAQYVFFIDGKIKKEDLHFTYDKFEEQVLYHENHYEAHHYVGWDVRSFYEQLVLIDRGKLSQMDFLYSNSKSIVMQEKPVDFAEGQLKRVGMLDALNPELKDKLRQSAGVVEHTFSKTYDADRVDVNLHFRKSRTSDISFLNKFEMTLHKAGDTPPLKQTFFTPPEFKVVNSDQGGSIRYDNKYTLKEAYNLLSGRPVFKNLLSKDGNPYQAWVKLDKSKVLENGNHEIKQYNTNYGFNLEKVLKEYSIKELANPQYYKNLIESLQRGNLQKVTFVGKEGKEQQLYISPSITTSSLNVYDTSQKRVPLERLVIEGYISQGLVDTLKEKFGQKQGQEVGPTVTETDRQKVKPAEKVRQETPRVKNKKQTGERKQTRKAKVS